jgi:hypothetical protein
MNNVCGQIEKGKTFRSLTVIGEFIQEAIGMDVNFPLPSERVICELEQIISWRGKQQAIRSENGPAYIISAIQNVESGRNIFGEVSHREPIMSTGSTGRYHITIATALLLRIGRGSTLCIEVDMVYRPWPPRCGFGRCHTNRRTVATACQF